MNIFILDEDIDKCAEYHVDKHVVKMILESAQLLCTAHWIEKYIGYTPRKLTSKEWAVVREHKKVEPRPFPYLPLCITTLVVCGCVVAWTIMNTYTRSPSHLMMNMDLDMENRINQCMMSYLNYQTSTYLDVDSAHLRRQCQMSLRDQMLLSPTGSSTTKTKQPSQVGKDERNHTGG